MLSVIKNINIITEEEREILNIFNDEPTLFKKLFIKNPRTDKYELKNKPEQRFLFKDIANEKSIKEINNEINKKINEIVKKKIYYEKNN